jgi:RNA polymerase sigma factor (sigma-70 family)
MSICLRYTNQREEARSMLNLGFYKILKNLKKFDLSTSFGSWIHRIMVNTLIDEYRKKKKQQERTMYIENYEEIREDTSVNSALVNMDVEQIRELIMKLPPVSQKVFNLYAIDGYTHKEIGELLGISEGTSRWHFNLSRTRLQEMILKINPSFNR